MAATRSRVGIPQAFSCCLTSKSCYLPDTHPNKSAPDNGSVRAFDSGEPIPEPFRFRERDPLPTVRPRPGAPVMVTSNHVTCSRYLALTFERDHFDTFRDTTAKPPPPHAIFASTCIPSAVIWHTCCSTPALEMRVLPFGLI
jgi:hypothetical protein